MANKHKKSLYFPSKMLEEVKNESNRLNVSVSWLMQQAWQLSSEKIKEWPNLSKPSEKQF